MSSVVGDCGELLSLDQGLFMVAWRNPFGLASHPRCSAPHESSRDSFQLCRACSSSMASAIVERSVVGVIESRGAVLCLGCGVVSGMGVGGQILGRCQTCQAKFDARMEVVEVHCTTHCSCGTCGWDPAVRSSVQWQWQWQWQCGTSAHQTGIGFASRRHACWRSVQFIGRA
jgi:hypothetical protein